MWDRALISSSGRSFKTSIWYIPKNLIVIFKENFPRKPLSPEMTAFISQGSALRINSEIPLETGERISRSVNAYYSTHKCDASTKDIRTSFRNH